ncbi:MAG: hypothetical protein E8D46_16830 [Nitrospira sp.]|nr:hypothetical protein [Nitrospira sp.]TKB71789.1 MAG: hypothetical protein E8D46_16830 [Nitrospira sp.]
MSASYRARYLAGLFLLLTACNNDTPVPATVAFSADQVRLTITRTATNPFLSRHDIHLTFVGPGGCSLDVDLFPNTGYASRRNLYQAGVGVLYVVGQFDARVIDVPHCTVTLAEFRTLDRFVTFLGSFDENEQKVWTYFPASQRPELPFEKR